MIYVPQGYTYGKLQFDNSFAHGGGPYGELNSVMDAREVHCGVQSRSPTGVSVRSRADQESQQPSCPMQALVP